ncbi:MAG: Quinolinate phosphoribosyltransferase [decarboxylating], partial [uncultured Blastococcus sp.]
DRRRRAPPRDRRGADVGRAGPGRGRARHPPRAGRGPGARPRRHHERDGAGRRPSVRRRRAAHPGGAGRGAGGRGGVRPGRWSGGRRRPARRRRLGRRARAAGADRHRTDPVAAHRGTHGAQPGQPPVRGGDPDPAVGGRRRRDLRSDPGHPQDHPRAAIAGEIRRPLRRRGQPPDLAGRRRAGQGQPRGRRGRDHRRRRGGGGLRARRSAGGRVRHPRPGARGGRSRGRAGAAGQLLASRHPVGRRTRARFPGAAGGQRRAVAGPGGRGGRDRRRLPGGRRADAQRTGARPGLRPPL